MIDPLPILSFQAVTKRFRNQSLPAVEGVTLSVPEGEIMALIGESGSGKTTLLRLAAGLEFPDRGQVLIESSVVADAEAPANEVPPEKRGLGLVFQDGALFPHLTAAKNVDYGMKSGTRKERARRVRECLELVDLPGMEKRFPHELSGGERQRLALARALAPAPRLLLLDEPFSHLDPALRRKLREEIRGILTRLGQTALLVTHDPEDVLAIATRVAILDQGRVQQIGTPSGVYRHPASQYCAERFGPANRVRDFETGKDLWKRPEDAIWHENEDEGVRVTVQSVRTLGNQSEIRVRPDGTDTVWVCLPGDEVELQPGDRGQISWKR